MEKKQGLGLPEIKTWQDAIKIAQTLNSVRDFMLTNKGIIENDIYEQLFNELGKGVDEALLRASKL